MNPFIDNRTNSIFFQDYEVVGDSPVGDEEWEQEINDMLEAEAASDKS